MRVTLPNIGSQSVTARANGLWKWVMEFDDSHREIVIPIPDTINVPDVEIFSQPLDIFGKVDHTRSTIVIKSKASKRRG
jgi:hypothetical protein